MAKRRVYLTYEGDTIKKPLIYEMGHKFKVITNVRTASISKTLGLVGLELEGDSEEIDNALAWAAAEGVTVEPIEMGVVEG